MPRKRRKKKKRKFGDRKKLPPERCKSSQLPGVGTTPRDGDENVLSEKPLPVQLTHEYYAKRLERAPPGTALFRKAQDELIAFAEGERARAAVAVAADKDAEALSARLDRECAAIAAAEHAEDDAALMAEFADEFPDETYSKDEYSARRVPAAVRQRQKADARDRRHLSLRRAASTPPPPAVPSIQPSATSAVDSFHKANSSTAPTTVSGSPGQVVSSRLYIKPEKTCSTPKNLSHQVSETKESSTNSTDGRTLEDKQPAEVDEAQAAEWMQKLLDDFSAELEDELKEGTAELYGQDSVQYRHLVEELEERARDPDKWDSWQEAMEEVDDIWHPPPPPPPFSTPMPPPSPPT